MRSKITLLFSLLVIASVLLSACQPAPAAEPQKIVETVIVAGTPWKE